MLESKEFCLEIVLKNQRRHGQQSCLKIAVERRVPSHIVKGADLARMIFDECRHKGMSQLKWVRRTCGKG